MQSLLHLVAEPVVGSTLGNLIDAIVRLLAKIFGGGVPG